MWNWLIYPDGTVAAVPFLMLLAVVCLVLYSATTLAVDLLYRGRRGDRIDAFLDRTLDRWLP